ncbi:hypothetical protein AB1Y20_004798 [Prymnesium parvum]|uniref:DDE-1 domain-containing protein n=1 Tax=Prymnesium parvum TaxID=97485 RepID=A0AB34J064_PRYPA
MTALAGIAASPLMRLMPPRLASLAAGMVSILFQLTDNTVLCTGTAPASGTDDATEYIVDAATRKKYGRYPPWCRLNVDQVPLPFVNDMEQTYDNVGAKRVVINQLGPALSKRQATGQICFRPAVPPPSGCSTRQSRVLYDKFLQEQPAPCILFRGKGNISEVEKNAYPPGLVVLWQDKAWVDRPLAIEWVEDVIAPFIAAERRAGVANLATRYLLFQDNLDSQKQPEYISSLKDLGVDDHKLPPNETDQVQPIDRGLGRQVKIYIGQQMDEWLDDDDNLTKWEDNSLSASDRRILLGTWYYRAVNKALQGEAKLKYFQHAGAMLTADGTDDDLIKLEGAPVGYKVVIPVE